MKKSPNRYVKCEGLFKIYKTSDIEVVALRGLELSIDSGEVISIVGASGSGKTTLLNILAGYDSPSAGSVKVGNYNLLQMNEEQSVRYRREEIGFIWQDTSENLFPYLSSIENIELPMLVSKISKNERLSKAEYLLELVNLSDRRDFKPFQLSGGEQQRIAIAVALSNSPRLLLADEPTGELDYNTGQEILQLINSVNIELGTTVIIVTHDELISSSVNRSIKIKDGKTSTEIRRSIDSSSNIDQEYYLIDSSGQLQIPATVVNQIGRRVKFSKSDSGEVIINSDE
ncbi:MAG: ABC transporter [Chloroflexi bacterium]|nr:ABC transporter [Chloroflexota bacterium]